MKTMICALMLLVLCTGCTWRDAAGVAAGSLVAVAIAAAGGDPMSAGPIEVGAGESVTAATNAALDNGTEKD